MGLADILDVSTFAVVDEYAVEDELNEGAKLQQIIYLPEKTMLALLTVARTIVQSSHPAVFTTTSRLYSLDPSVKSTSAKDTAIVATARVLIESFCGRLLRSMWARSGASMACEENSLNTSEV